MYDSNRNLTLPPESTESTTNVIGTVVNVSELRLSREMVDHVIGLIEAERDAHFAPGTPGGQRAMAAKMHMKQPTLNRLLKKREGVGVDVLLSLRAYFADEGRPLSVEQILGIEPRTARTANDRAYDELLARYSNLEAAVHLLRTKPHVLAKEKAEALESVAKAKRAVGGNAELRKKKAG